MSAKYNLIVIGSGPGGYVAAIRASQLGMKVAVVERAELGGICLNWGCIPTKALLKSAQVFEYINHAKDYGINVKDASIDFGGMVKRSRDVAAGMSKGINFLFKKNKIDVIAGFGKLKPGKKVEVEDEDGYVNTAQGTMFLTPPPKPPYAWLAIGGLVLIAGGIVFWQWQKKQQENREMEVLLEQKKYEKAREEVSICLSLRTPTYIWDAEL